MFPFHLSTQFPLRNVITKHKCYVIVSMILPIHEKTVFVVGFNSFYTAILEKHYTSESFSSYITHIETHISMRQETFAH